MPTTLPPSPRTGGNRSSKGKLTGSKIILILIGFFGTVGVVDAFMVYQAITTYPGEVVDRPYERGLHYNDDIALAHAQSERGWQVDGHIARDSNDGLVHVTYTIIDKSGAPVKGLASEIHFAAPATTKFDKRFDLVETDAGVYAGSGTVAPGAWEVTFTAMRDGEQMFKSINPFDLP